MRLLRDEQAYRRILVDFVAQRLSAAAFIARFRHLWRGALHDQTGFYGLLDSVNTLCETFAHNLPSGCGYRVSEEQFRKEVQSLVSTLPVPGIARP
jgi:hypothetical protein